MLGIRGLLLGVWGYIARRLPDRCSVNINEFNRACSAATAAAADKHVLMQTRAQSTAGNREAGDGTRGHVTSDDAGGVAAGGEKVHGGGC